MILRSHILEIRVRYSECDPMGVAHHSAYPVWFEMGRTELLRASSLKSESTAADGNCPLSYRDLEAQGIFLAVVSLNVRYKRPARYDDVLMLHTTFKGAAHVKIEHVYELQRDSLVLAIGSTTLACLDRQGRPCQLPDSLRIRDDVKIGKDA